MDKRTFNLMWLGGGSTGSRYWILSLNGDGTDIINDIEFDSLGNIYVIGYTNSIGSGGNDIFLAKIAKNGVLQWQIALGNSTTNVGNGITIDSSDNIYIVGNTESSSNLYLAKYDTSGILQWQRSLDGSSTEEGNKIVTDSSGNIYVAGRTNSKGAGGYDLLLARYNSSGTLQWQRAYGGASDEEGYDLTIDSSGGIYVVGSTNSIRATTDIVLIKYTSTGSITWQRSLGGIDNPVGFSVCTDTSNNIYIVGSTGKSLSRNILIAKYNSSGTIQWQKTIQGTESNSEYQISIDSSNNIYILSIKYDDNRMYMAKLNSSGSLIWQRSIGNTSEIVGDIGINLDGDVVIGWTSGILTSYGIYVAKLPNDGSKLGTYGDIVYSNVTLTMVSNTYFSNTITLTNNTSINLVENTTISLSEYTGNLISTLTKI